jgi:hypothetical protein
MVAFVRDLARSTLGLVKRLMADLCLIPVVMVSICAFLILMSVLIVAVILFPSSVLDEAAS